MIISLTNFAGIAPMLAPNMLAPNQAQQALNCQLWTGGIDAVYNASSVTTVASSTAKKAIYKFGTTGTDADYWFTWTVLVNVVRGMISGDTEEKTYYTGDGPPKVTGGSIALTGSGNNYPVSWYYLGVPSPASPPTLSVSGTSAGGVAETHAYVYTYVTAWGEESAPSGAATATKDPAQTINVVMTGTGPTTGPGGTGSPVYNVTHKRIYRSQVGTTTSSYYFVAEVPVASYTSAGYPDAVSAASLGEVLPTLFFSEPPVALSGLVALPNGIMAGFVGRDLYFCEPYKPYAWPLSYVLSVDQPIVALAAIQQNLLVLTAGSPYMVTGGDPANMSMEKLRLNQSCVSARSVAPFNNGIIYASPDGLVYVGTDGSDILTKSWMTRRQWQALNPSSMHGVTHDQRYYGFYDLGTGTKGGFILDPTTQNGVLTTTDVYADASYSDLVQDALFYSINGTIYKWAAGTTKKTFGWKSKPFVPTRPTSFSAAQVIATDYTDVHVEFIFDGVSWLTQTVTSNVPFRLPSGFLCTIAEVVITGTSPVVSVAFATTLEELGGV